MPPPQPHAAPPAPPPPTGGAPATPAALWAATLERLADRPSLVWLRHLRLERLDGETAFVSVAPGQREVLHIATPQRLEIVAQTMGELRGQRTRIELRAGQGAAPTPDQGPADDEPAQPGRPAQVDRRAALQLPIVRAALQAFPDAMLIDAREESADDQVAQDPEGQAAPPPPADVPEPDPLDDEEEY